MKIILTIFKLNHKFKIKRFKYEKYCGIKSILILFLIYFFKKFKHDLWKKQNYNEDVIAFYFFKKVKYIQKYYGVEKFCGIDIT